MWRTSARWRRARSRFLKGGHLLPLKFVAMSRVDDGCRRPPYKNERCSPPQIRHVSTIKENENDAALKGTLIAAWLRRFRAISPYTPADDKK